MEASREILYAGVQSNKDLWKALLSIPDITPKNLPDGFIKKIMNCIGTGIITKEKINNCGVTLCMNAIIVLLDVEYQNLMKMATTQDKKDKVTEIYNNKKKFFSSQLFKNAFEKPLESKYTEWYRKTLNIGNLNDFRGSVLENGVGPQTQCSSTIIDVSSNTTKKDSIRQIQSNEQTDCYLCGRKILRVELDDPMECEHILPISTALSNWWIYRNSRYNPEQYDGTMMTRLKQEYKWAHKCCNQVKNNDEFIVYSTSGGTTRFVPNIKGIKRVLIKIKTNKSVKWKCQQLKSNSRGELDVNTRADSITSLITPMINTINENINLMGGYDMYILFCKFKAISAINHAMFGQILFDTPNASGIIQQLKNVEVEIDYKKEIANIVKQLANLYKSLEYSKTKAVLTPKGQKKIEEEKREITRLLTEINSLLSKASTTEFTDADKKELILDILKNFVIFTNDEIIDNFSKRIDEDKEPQSQDVSPNPIKQIVERNTDVQNSEIKSNRVFSLFTSSQTETEEDKTRVLKFFLGNEINRNGIKNDVKQQIFAQVIDSVNQAVVESVTDDELTKVVTKTLQDKDIAINKDNLYDSIGIPTSTSESFLPEPPDSRFRIYNYLINKVKTFTSIGEVIRNKFTQLRGTTGGANKYNKYKKYKKYNIKISKNKHKKLYSGGNPETISNEVHKIYKNLEDQGSIEEQALFPINDQSIANLKFLLDNQEYKIYLEDLFSYLCDQTLETRYIESSDGNIEYSTTYKQVIESVFYGISFLPEWKPLQERSIDEERIIRECRELRESERKPFIPYNQCSGKDPITFQKLGTADAAAIKLTTDGTCYRSKTLSRSYKDGTLFRDGEYRSPITQQPLNDYDINRIKNIACLNVGGKIYKIHKTNKKYKKTIKNTKRNKKIKKNLHKSRKNKKHKKTKNKYIN